MELIDASINKMVRRCNVASRVTRARPTFDGQTVIVSSEGFLARQALIGCGKQPLAVQKVPADAGILQDVNVGHGVYISLLPVSTQPISFLAIVGNIGSSKNLIELPGAFVDRQSEKVRLQNAFVYSDDTDEHPRISIDGRYVSVSGEVDCSSEAYPGVWDLKRKRKVVVNGGERERKSLCQALFGVAPIR